MTLMLILGGVAIVYCLLLLFRCAKYALPLFAGLALAVYLRDHSYGWLTILAAGLLAGISVHAFGRHIAGSSAPFAIRFCVILLFAGTAAAAGYQAGGALAELADLEPWADRGISMLIALLTGFASWRDLVPPGNGTALHA
jgi:predicted anti-sigma-YlaC factor YlaD